MTQLAPISVIIPTYNYGHFLSRALTSIIKQTIPVAEIIVVDDGSTDDTATIMQTWLELSLNTHIYYHYQSNRGPGAARNYGARLANQPWVLFLDADDELRPNAAQDYLEAIFQHPAIQVFFARYRSIGVKKDHDHPISLFSADKLQNTHRFLLDKAYSSSTSGRLLLTTCVATQIPYAENIRHGEDIFLVALLLANFNCYGLNDIVVNIHSHNDSLRHQHEHALIDIIHVVDTIFDSPHFPLELQIIRKDYLIRRLYAKANTYLKMGNSPKARETLKSMVILQPRVLLQIKWFKRYIKSFLIQASVS